MGNETQRYIMSLSVSWSDEMGSGIASVDPREHADGGWCKWEDVQQLEADIKFLLSFAPDEPPPGLDPTFYHTLTHKGDMELWERIKKIKGDETKKPLNHDD